MIQPGLRWYVVKTKPHRESEVRQQLARRNIETYSPMLKTFRKYLSRGQRQIEPLFPTYLFVSVDLARFYEDFRRLSGLRGVVRFGDYVPHLEAEVIADFRRRETPDGYIRIRGWTLRASQPVRITGGLFAGQEGLFSGYLNAPERVCILMNFLHRKVRVELPAVQVRPVTSSLSAAL